MTNHQPILDSSGRQSWANQLRGAIRADGRSLHAIAKAAGVHYTSLRAFMAGKSILFETAELLANATGYQKSDNFMPIDNRQSIANKMTAGG